MLLLSSHVTNKFQSVLILLYENWSNNLIKERKVYWEKDPAETNTINKLQNELEKLIS